MTDVCLIQMPFANFYQPSHALSLLKACLTENSITCKVFYQNIRFAEMTGIHNYIAPDYYGTLAMSGEWVFSETAGFEACDSFFYEVEKSGAIKHLDRGMYPKINERHFTLKNLARPFLDGAVTDVLRESPVIAGCTSSFQQNNACFSLLKMIKEQSPATITIIGGSNCALESGLAISRELPFIDFVFSGEGDEVFAQFVHTIMCRGADCPLEALPHGVLRRGGYASGELPFHITKNLNNMPIPDYSDYFEAMSRSALKEVTLVSLPIEGSRGCWWREKRHCSFCGLGQKQEKFREKSTDRLVSEIETLGEQYGVMKYSFSDSILSRTHIRELPEMLDNGRNVGKTFFCEIKSNIDKETVRRLRKAGFCFLQPGIESLQDDYLTLMNKGNTAISHLALLKYCRSYGVILHWNLLLGFPGEKEDYTREMLALIPAVTHLPPPKLTHHFVYQKNSVYCEHPEKYGLTIKPTPFFGLIYKGAERFADDAAYFYEPAEPDKRAVYYDISLKSDVYKQFMEALAEWTRRFYQNGDRLTQFAYEDRIEILDYRKCAKRSWYTLVDAERAIYLEADAPVSRQALLDRLHETYAPGQIEMGIRFLLETRLLVEINGRLLAMATEITPYPYVNYEDNPAGWIFLKGNDDE